MVRVDSERQRAERRAAPKPARASRKTRPALWQPKSALAGSEPQPSFTSGDRSTYSSSEGLQ